MWPVGQLKQMNTLAAMKARRSETDIQRAILDALALLPDLLVWRNNVGTRGHVHYGLGPGSADIIGVLRSYRAVTHIGRGLFIALEVKRDATCKPEPHQAEWLQSVRDIGGFAAVVWNVPSALSAIHRARNGWSR